MSSYSVLVPWTDSPRGQEVIKWVETNCESYDRLYARVINPHKPFNFGNINMELWFNDEKDANWCKLRWT